jgi:hypothetical protein
MRIPSVATCTLTAAIALTALPGCGSSAPMAPAPLMQSGAASQSISRPGFQNSRLNRFLAMRGDIVPAHPAAGPSFMDRRAGGKPLVFAGFADGIDIYLQGGKNKKVGQITGLAGAGTFLATDTSGSLYSGNYGFSSSSVTVYAPPYTDGPKLTITGRVNGPIAVSRQGTVAVEGCTIPSGSKCDEGVLFYAAGSTTPCASVRFDTSAFPNVGIGAAFDHQGNLYAASAGTGSEAPLTVDRIDGGCDAKKGRVFTTANSVVYAGGLEVAKAGRIAILVAIGTDPYTAVIYAYDPPKKGSLGNPVSSTSLPGSVTGPNDDISGLFAFQASGRRLWAGYDYVGSSYAAAVNEFSYPGGTPQKNILGPAESGIGGVAVTPALVP